VIDVEARFDGDAFVLAGQRHPREMAAQALYERWFVHGGRVAAPLSGRDPLIARDFAHALARARRTGTRLEEGWLFANGRRGAASGEPRARVYLHLPWQGAVPALGALEAWDAARVPFRFKILADPAAFGRVDAAVLYLPRSALATPALPRFHARIAPWLREETPPFARRLGRGVAWADDASERESFGQSRCRILAEGLSRGDADAAFRAEGLDPRRPHLAPGRVDVRVKRLRDAPVPAWGRAA
jgi:hypothetical protein